MSNTSSETEIKYNFAPDPNLLGYRFVFFNSLNNVNPRVKHFFAPVLAKGQEYVRESKAMLTGQDKLSQDTQLSNMQLYINFMLDMAKNEQINEINFVKKTKTQWAKNKDIPQDLKEHMQFFLDKIDGQNQLNNTEYFQLISLINSILQKNNKNQTDKDKTYSAMGDAVQKALKFCKENNLELYETLKQEFLYEGPTKKYREEIVRLVRETNDTFTSTWSSIAAEKINSIILNLRKDDNFLAKISDNIEGDIEGDKLIALIVSYVADESVDLIEQTSGKDIAQSTKLENYIENNYKKISSEYVKSVMNQVTRKSEKTIEELAVTTGRGTGALFKELDDAKAFMDKYDIQGTERDYLSKLKDSLKTIKTKQERAKQLERASKIINNAIRRFAKESIAAMQDSQETITKEALKDWAIEQGKLWQKDAISSAFTVRFSSGAVGELNSVIEMIDSEDIVQAIENPGTGIKLKNDLVVFISFNENKIKRNKNPNLAAIEQSFNEIPEQFMNRYYTYGGKTNETQLTEAMRSYEEIFQQIADKIQQLLSMGKINQKEAEKLYAELQESFIGGISVKDYMYATNDFGFHGGSIGSNIEKVMENISTMYELGGISKSDSEKLYFSAVNCASDTIGSNLKDSLEMFLSGAAAILMFDEGFAASSTFLEKMKKKLGFSAPHSLHLFRVNNKYIPASYIYSTIANNLEEVFSSLQSTVNKIEMSSMIHITNNIDESIKPSYTDIPEPITRWETVRDIAAESTDIQISFTFLAGFLDILEKLPNAFNNNI